MYMYICVITDNSVMYMYICVSIFVLCSLTKPTKMLKGNEGGHGDGIIFGSCIQRINWCPCFLSALHYY